MEILKKFEEFVAVKSQITQRHNAIIYTRVSTKDQADNNTSLETQLKYCKKFAEDKNLNVVAQFGGTNESAKSDERKEFQKMLRYAKQNNTIGVILVYSYDRFSRTGTSASFITEELGKMGITVISVTQVVDTKNPGGVFQQNLFYLFSQFDNEMRRDKTKTAMIELLRKGYWLWTPPRGYQNQNKFQKATEWNIIINKEGELLRQAFEWRVNNNYSSASISRRLKFMGMDVNEKRLLEIFRNPFYCGILVSKLIPGEVIVGRHSPIVSYENFLEINQTKNIDLNRTYDTMSEFLPLKKLAVCSKCGNLLTGFLNKKKNIYYYRCQKKCLGESINANKFHDGFENILSQYKISKEFLPIIEELIQFKLLELMQSDEMNLSNMKTNLTNLKNELNTLEERFAFGKIDSDLFTKYNSKLLVEINELEEKIDGPKLISSNLKKCIKNGLMLSKNLSKLWQSGDVFEKHKLQQIVFPEGIGYDKQNDRVQTIRINSIFELIHSVSRSLKEIKNGESVQFDQFSALVTL